MKTMLLVGEKAEQDAAALRAALGEGYALRAEESCAEAVRLMAEGEEYTALLIDEPSRQEGVRELLDEVHSGVHSFAAIPVLLVCDREDLDRDAQFLGGPVADLVVKPVTPAILKNRLSRATERANSMSYTELTDILRLLPSNIYIKDARCRYIFSSEDLHQEGLRPDMGEVNILGKTDLEIRADKDNARMAMLADMEIIRTGKGTDYIIQVPGEDGPQFLQVIKEAIKAPDGRSRGIITLINNVTEQERLRQRLEKMSITDQLTGLYNRAYLDIFAKQLRASPEQYPVSLISADCDGLKYVNDTLGHLSGDEYLRNAAALFRSVLPERSAAFRLGGDEFLILIPRTEAEEAEALTLALEENAEKYTVRSLHLSISIGFGTLMSPADDFAACFKNSDESMYQHKRKKKREGLYPFHAV